MRIIEKVKKIESVLEYLGYDKTPNGYVKYLDYETQQKYNVERFHFKDNKLHLDGNKQGLHFVRKDMWGKAKRLMDEEVQTIRDTADKIKQRRKELHVKNNPPNPNKKKKIKPEYAPNIMKLQKLNLNERPINKLRLIIRRFFA